MLRLGCFEASQLGVPAAVATDGMVRLTRKLGKSSASGMVNAVLRKAVRTDVLTGASPDLRWSHPEWLWRRWAGFFGAAAAERAMEAAQAPAAPWVWFADEDSRSRIEDAGVALEPHPWCPGAWTAGEGRPELMKAVRQGRANVQDPSSQLVARLAVSLTGGTGCAADLCAAPGGKSSLIRALGRWRVFVAGDNNPPKVGRLARRLGPVPLVVADAGRPALTGGSWDLVLLDAPCSGTGTLRRHPELKWRLSSETISGAAGRQRSMIEAGGELLASGGTLVYATCSVEPEENEAHFQIVPDGFEMAPLEDQLPDGLPWIETGSGGVRILPHEFGDGFTVHALRRAG